MSHNYEYIVHLQPYDPVATSTRDIWLSESGYRTGAADTPSDVMMPGCLIQPFIFRRGLWQNEEIGGHSAPGHGEIILGRLADQFQDWADLAWNQRFVEIYRGNSKQNFSTFVKIFTGVAEQIRFRDEQISVLIKDRQYLLQKPIIESTYSSSVDGVAGQIRQVVFGTADAVPLALINSSSLIYETSAQPIQSISLYDRGVSLSQGSDYTVNLSSAQVDLSAAADEPLQATVGALPGLGASTAADTIKHIVTTFTSLTYANDFDQTAFTALNSGASEDLGMVTPRESFMIEQALDLIATAIHGFYYFGHDGKLTAGRFAAPTGGADFIIDHNNFESIELLPSKLPVWQVRVGWHHRWGVAAPGVIGASVGANLRNLLSTEYSWRKAEDSSIKTVHPAARILEIPTVLSAFAGGFAQTLADDLLSLYGTTRHVYVIRCFGRPGSLNLHDVISVDLPDFGLNSKMFRLIALEEDAATHRLELTLWG